MDSNASDPWECTRVPALDRARTDHIERGTEAANRCRWAGKVGVLTEAHEKNEVIYHIIEREKLRISHFCKLGDGSVCSGTVSQHEQLTADPQQNPCQGQGQWRESITSALGVVGTGGSLRNHWSSTLANQ